MTVTNDQVVTSWAASLTRWDEDRIETEFTDPASGELFTFIITRSPAEPSLPAGDDQARKVIRARGEAMRDLAKAHAPEFDALLSERLRELGIGMPELARQT